MKAMNKNVYVSHQCLLRPQWLRAVIGASINTDANFFHFIAVLRLKRTDTEVLKPTLAYPAHWPSIYLPESAELILILAFSTDQTEGGQRTLLYSNSPIKVMWNTACFGSHTPLQFISMLSISSLHTLCAYRVIHCTTAHTYAISLRSKAVEFQWQKGSGFITACTRGSCDAFLYNVVAETAPIYSSINNYKLKSLNSETEKKKREKK